MPIIYKFSFRLLDLSKSTRSEQKLKNLSLKEAYTSQISRDWFMKRDYVVFVPKIDTGSRITRSACHFVTSYPVTNIFTPIVKGRLGSREQEEKKKKKYEERGWEWREKLSNRSLDSLVSIAGPLRRGNAVTDNGTVLRRRSPMWEYCYSNDAAFLSVPLLSSFLLVLFLCHPASVKQHGCLLVAP